MQNLSFSLGKVNILTLRLKRVLCNTLIQTHFDYGCISWFPLLNKNLKHKLQTAQNKCKYVFVWIYSLALTQMGLISEKSTKFLGSGGDVPHQLKTWDCTIICQSYVSAFIQQVQYYFTNGIGYNPKKNKHRTKRNYGFF